MIHVIAIVRCKPGRRQEVLDIFNANVPAVLTEDGCLEYQAAIDSPASTRPLGPDAFMVVEKWRDLDALGAHAAAPHMSAYKNATATLVDDVAVHVLDPVS